MSASTRIHRSSVRDIVKRKGGAPIVCLTAYTATVAKILDRHVDLILVGDSLGMVCYGMDNTQGVSVDMMINHGAAVVRATARACVVVDLPFGSYESGPPAAFDPSGGHRHRRGDGRQYEPRGESVGPDHPAHRCRIGRRLRCRSGRNASSPQGRCAFRHGVDARPRGGNGPGHRSRRACGARTRRHYRRTSTRQYRLCGIARRQRGRRTQRDFCRLKPLLTALGRGLDSGRLPGAEAKE